MCQNLIFIKVADWRTATLLKKTLRHRYFPVHFANSFRKPPLKIMKVFQATAVITIVITKKHKFIEFFFLSSNFSMFIY